MMVSGLGVTNGLFVSKVGCRDALMHIGTGCIDVVL